MVFPLKPRTKVFIQHCSSYLIKIGLLGINYFGQYKVRANDLIITFIVYGKEKIKYQSYQESKISKNETDIMKL